jgi:trigger factor
VVSPYVCLLTKNLGQHPMQVTELDSKGLHKQFKITVDASRINESVEQELRNAGEKIKIPGFRPGNIPMKVLKQRYGKSVQADVLKNLINETTTEVIKERNLRPAQTPSINIQDYKEGGELVYEMSFDAFPEVPEIKFDKITLDRKTFEVPASEIDDALTRIAERSPKLSPKKEGTKAAKGDVVKIDFVGKLDGVAFDGGTANDFDLELGGGQFIEGFEEQLIGSKSGDDKLVTVTFPDNYPSANLAGKETTFAVKIKEVQGKELPEINDDFAKERGLADLAALRDAVSKQIEGEYNQLVRNQLKKQLFDILEEQYEFELPQGMVDVEFSTIWERLMQAKKEGDATLADKSEEELKEEYMQVARRRVKLGILLAEVGHRSKVQISREELMRAVMQQASMFPGQEQKVMEFYRNHPERMDELRGPILEEKAVDHILSKATFNDKKVSLDELTAQDDENEESDSKKKSAKSKAKPAEDKDADKAKAAPKKKAAK